MKIESRLGTYILERNSRVPRNENREEKQETGRTRQRTAYSTLGIFTYFMRTTKLK